MVDKDYRPLTAKEVAQGIEDGGITSEPESSTNAGKKIPTVDLYTMALISCREISESHDPNGECIGLLTRPRIPKVHNNNHSTTVGGGKGGKH